jgi:hypothetical protein
LIVAAGTLVGITALATSSAYDYHLQTAQPQMESSTGSMGSTESMGSMGSMDQTSPGSPLAAEYPSAQQASLGLQVRAVAYGSGLLFFTNLALVGCIAAMRGGRLKMGTTQRGSDDDADRDIRQRGDTD